MSELPELFWLHEQAIRYQYKLCLGKTAQEAMNRYMRIYPDNIFDNILHKIQSYKLDPKADPTDIYTICVDGRLCSKQPPVHLFKIVASLVWKGEE